MEKKSEDIITLENKNTRIIKLEKKTKTDKSMIKITNFNQSENDQTKNNEYITKGRKTLNPSLIHLQSPKKENPSRSKRITLFRNSAKKAMQEYEEELEKQNKNNLNLDFISNFVSGEPFNQKISDELINNNFPINNKERYKFIIKRIAKKLRKRVKLPKCKIFKFYNSYRMLILRISKGIKKTAKRLNFWEKWENKSTEKEMKEIQIASSSYKIFEQRKKSFKKEINIGLSHKKKNIQINLSLFKKNEEKEKLNLNKNKNDDLENKNIIFLKNLDTSINNNNFINQFRDFLQKANIEIDPDSKIPYFKNNEFRYLLSRIEFWLKYIIYISKIYKESLSIYNFTNFIEQFYLWSDINENNNYNDFNNEIIKQIYLLFDNNTINNFLIVNKLNNINFLFLRYKNIYNIKKNKEVKIDTKVCECQVCKGLFYEKVINYNIKNNQIMFSEENHLSYKGKNKSENKNIKIKNKSIYEYFSSNEKNSKEKKKRTKSKNKYKTNKIKNN